MNFSNSTSASGFLENFIDSDQARMSKVLAATCAGVRPKHTWVAPKQKRLEECADDIDPQGWRDWLRTVPDSYPPRFAIYLPDVQDDDHSRHRAHEVEKYISELASTIETFSLADFAYYTKDDDGFLVPEERESCHKAYSFAISAYEHRHRSGLETQALFHCDIPTDIHKGERPTERPFSALLNIPQIRTAIAKRLAQLRNMGGMILPPAYLEEANRRFSPRLIQNLKQHTLVDFQVLVGSGGMREYKDLKRDFLSDNRALAKCYQDAIWNRTGIAYLISVAEDGRILEYASPPGARRQSGPINGARDRYLQQSAVPIIIDGAIQCTVVVGAFLREMLELAPNWLYINCDKDLGDLEKAGNAGTYISAHEWTKSGLVYKPDRIEADIAYVSQTGDQLSVSGIFPEVCSSSDCCYGNLDEVYNESILPRFSATMAAYDVPPERIFLMGSIGQREIRQHVLREMCLTRRIPLVSPDGTLIRRFLDGRFEKRLYVPSAMVKNISVGASGTMPSCTIGDPQSCGCVSPPDLSGKKISGKIGDHATP